jgi:RNA polymerase sigma factor (sigma-70 family)
MAYVMLGDLPSAEDVVQEAFYGLYRRWDRLADTAGALYYVRTSVLNGCRSALRHRAVRRGILQHGPLADPPPAVSAETVVLGGEEVIRALRRLPDRQREVLVLRFYAELPDEQIARVMGIRPGTVRSTASRTALARVTPLAAGVGVAAALALVFALAGLIHPGRPANGRPGGRAALPRYYVALSYTGSEQCCEPGKPASPVTHAVVRVTTTGQTLATIEPPRPYGTFVAVTAAADDRTFVLAAQPRERLTQFSTPPRHEVLPPADRPWPPRPGRPGAIGRVAHPGLPLRGSRRRPVSGRRPPGRTRRR